MNDFAAKIIGQLPKIGAFKIGAFRLKLHESDPDALLSPFYINLRVIRSFPNVLDYTAAAIGVAIAGLEFDLLADVPTGGTPIVSVMVIRSQKGMISPRTDKKQHGTGDAVDGVYKRGQTVLLVDDLVTSAASKLEAISILEENDLLVRDVAVFLDRQQGGRDQLKQAGYRLHAAATLDDLFEVIYESKILSPQAEDLCRLYRAGELSAGWEKSVKKGWNIVV